MQYLHSDASSLIYRIFLLGNKPLSFTPAEVPSGFAPAMIALMVFHEHISPRLWLGILFITLSCALLSFEDLSSLRFSSGSLFVLLAACCWGMENNCTRKISSRDPLQVVLLKGIFSGTGSIVIGFVIGERITHLRYIPLVLLLGFVAYGLSIYFYVYAQRELGAARTSAYYAVAPFIGSFLSLIIFRSMPGVIYFNSFGQNTKYKLSPPETKCQ